MGGSSRRGSTLYNKAMDAIIERLFQVQGTWGCLNLNQLAKEQFSGAAKNPLLNPDCCASWVEAMTRKHGLDFSYGGYLEDRKDLWRGHYHAPGQMMHLGVDYNVPAGTEVYCPERIVVAEFLRDPDQRGGWGGRLVLRNSRREHLVLAHLGQIKLPAPGTMIYIGELLGYVGESFENGGWYPHLHVQCVRKPSELVDGYAAESSSLKADFPHPDTFLIQ